MERLFHIDLHSLWSRLYLWALETELIYSCIRGLLKHIRIHAYYVHHLRISNITRSKWWPTTNELPSENVSPNTQLYIRTRPNYWAPLCIMFFEWLIILHMYSYTHTCHDPVFVIGCNTCTMYPPPIFRFAIRTSDTVSNTLYLPPPKSKFDVNMTYAQNSICVWSYDQNRKFGIFSSAAGPLCIPGVDLSA